MRIVLASASVARRAMLQAAGVSVEAEAAFVDEAEAKQALRAEGAGVGAAATRLAELKALRVAGRLSGALIIGADQMLECDGEWFDKPEDAAALRRQLERLRGRRHTLTSAAVVALDGRRIWHGIEQAALDMRPFSQEFLDSYLLEEGEAVLGSVGGYRIEGRGAQLFSRITGSWPAILGLPLLPLLAFLRERGVIAQ